MAGKDDKNLPYNLENMSIPELEALLQQDFLTSDGCSPDTDYIMAIVEVIHKKEQALPDYQPLDTAKAWEEFKSFYRTEEGRANSIYRFGGGTEDKIFRSKTEKQPPKHKKSKTFRRFVLIAASLCLLVALTCVPVFGYQNVFQMLASWTAEQFGFYMPPKERSVPEQVPEEFEELQEIMQQLGADLIIPRFPEGFEAKPPKLSYFPDDGILKFMIIYQLENDYYLFSVNRDNIINTFQYEKSDSLVDTKLYNNVKYYYLENNGNSTVAWYIDTTEYYIVTNRAPTDLNEILDFIYNE